MPHPIRPLIAKALIAFAWAVLGTGAQAAWTCTNEAGKMTFQDRPCEAKAPSAKWEAVKANDLTTEGALETLRRFDGAVNERDMASAGRLLAKDFKAIQIDKRGRSEVGQAAYIDAVTRVVQASRRYQSEHVCGEGRPEALSQTLRLDCRRVERVDAMRRVNSAERYERVRLVLEGGEIRISEITESAAPEAAAAASGARN